jgi:hypothetical protein
MEQIGKSFIQQQQHNQHQPPQLQQQKVNSGQSPAASSGSPNNGMNTSIYTSHQPLSIEMIMSLTRHAKTQCAFFILLNIQCCRFWVFFLIFKNNVKFFEF